MNSFRTSVIGLALSVAALSVTLAIFTGFERTLALSLSNSLGHLTHYTKWHSRAEMEHLVSLAPPGIAKTVFFWTSQGLIVGPKGGRGVLIEGRSNTGADVPPGSPVLVDLGKPLAEALGLKTGDRFRILLPGILRGSVDAKVRPLAEFGMYDIDSRLAIVIDESLRPVMADKDPEGFANRPGDAHGIRYQLNVAGHDPSDVGWVEKWNLDYQRRLKDGGVEEKNALFRTWKDLEKNLLGSIGLDKKVLIVVMGLLTLVATLNVAATLVVLFLERDREMAVLRAIGLSPRKLLAWITAQGFLMGVVASALGLCLGRIFGWTVQQLPLARLPSDIYHISQLPLRFDWREQTATFAFGIAASALVAGLLGLRLAKTNILGVLGARR